MLYLLHVCGLFRCLSDVFFEWCCASLEFVACARVFVCMCVRVSEWLPPILFSKPIITFTCFFPIFSHSTYTSHITQSRAHKQCSLCALTYSRFESRRASKAPKLSFAKLFFLLRESFHKCFSLWKFVCFSLAIDRWEHHFALIFLSKHIFSNRSYSENLKTAERLFSRINRFQMHQILLMSFDLICLNWVCQKRIFCCRETTIDFHLFNA